jgi:hypothetical protein
MPDEEIDQAPPIDEPTALRFIGPATAAVIEDASFGAEAIRDRQISFQDLIEAGVNRGVAAKLRREFSLVWAFDWAPGADLDRRAIQVTGLVDGQREWVAASFVATTDQTEDRPDELTEDERSRQAWLEASIPDEPDEEPCPRCGGDLDRFELGDHLALQCANCGYAGIPVGMNDGGDDRDEGWVDVIRGDDRSLMD